MPVRPYKQDWFLYFALCFKTWYRRHVYRQSIFWYCTVVGYILFCMRRDFYCFVSRHATWLTTWSSAVPTMFIAEWLPFYCENLPWQNRDRGIRKPIMVGFSFQLLMFRVIIRIIIVINFYWTCVEFPITFYGNYRPTISQKKQWLKTRPLKHHRSLLSTGSTRAYQL